MEFFYYNQEGVEVNIPAPNFEPLENTEAELRMNAAWFAEFRKEHPECKILNARIYNSKGEIEHLARFSVVKLVDDSKLVFIHMDCPTDIDPDEWRYMRG